MKKLEELDFGHKKYIIFDMDGTLIDSIGIWNLTDYRIIKHYSGCEVDLEYIRKDREHFLEEHTSSDIYYAYCDYLKEKYQMSVEASELYAYRIRISSEILETEMEYRPGAVELIKKLKELGFVLVLATITTQTQLDIYSYKNKKMCSQMNLMETFDYVIRKEDVKNKKPNPEIYQLVLAHYGIDPSECLVFEDSLPGIMAAKGAGIETVNIYDQHSDSEREEINRLTDYYISHYQEFISIMLNQKVKKKVEEK